MNKETREEKLLLLLRYDAESLYERITERAKEYLSVFAMKRTRGHFPVIFENRHKEISLESLSICSSETIDLIYQFYGLVEETFWYVMHTEDMPQTVEDRVHTKIKTIKKIYPQLIEVINQDIYNLSNDEDHQQEIDEGPSVDLETQEEDFDEFSLEPEPILETDDSPPGLPSIPK